MLNCVKGWTTTQPYRPDSLTGSLATKAKASIPSSNSAWINFGFKLHRMKSDDNIDNHLVKFWIQNLRNNMGNLCYLWKKIMTSTTKISWAPARSQVPTFRRLRLRCCLLIHLPGIWRTLILVSSHQLTSPGSLSSFPQSVWPHWGVLTRSAKVRCSIAVAQEASGIFPLNFHTECLLWHVHVHLDCAS